MYLCVFVWMWEEGGGMCEVGGIVSKFAKFDLVCGGYLSSNGNTYLCKYTDMRNTIMV